MESSGFFVDTAPRERRALGYRLEDDAWHLEPTLTHVAFGAMGGIQTSATDTPSGRRICCRPGHHATIRTRDRSCARRSANSRRARIFHSSCRRAPETNGRVRAHAPPPTGWEFGSRLTATSAYISPTLAAIPATGRMCCFCQIMTSAHLSVRQPDAMRSLRGLYSTQPLPCKRRNCSKVAQFLSVRTSPARTARSGAIYRQGNVAAGGDVLAMNFLMDRDAQGWGKDLEDLKKQRWKPVRSSIGRDSDQRAFWRIYVAL